MMRRGNLPCWTQTGQTLDVDKLWTDFGFYLFEKDVCNYEDRLWTKLGHGQSLDRVWTWTFFGQSLDLDKLLTKLRFCVFGLYL